MNPHTKKTGVKNKLLWQSVGNVKFLCYVVYVSVLYRNILSHSCFFYKFVLSDIFFYPCVYNGVVCLFAPTFCLTGEYVFGLMCSDLLLGKNK